MKTLCWWVTGTAWSRKQQHCWTRIAYVSDPCSSLPLLGCHLLPHSWAYPASVFIGNLPEGWKST